MGSAELGIFGGAGSGALPPIERHDPVQVLPVERSLESADTGTEETGIIIEHIKPSSITGTEAIDGSVRVNLAATAPWGQTGELAVGQLNFVPQPKIEDQTVEEPSSPKKGYRYNRGLELQDLDIERMEMRAKLEEAKAAIAELDIELTSLNFAQRTLLMARTLKHRKATELTISSLESRMQSNELRRQALIVRREREKQVREDMRQLAGHEGWEMGDDSNEAWHSQTAV